MSNFKAVITADILNSTQFAAEISSGWLEELISILKTQNIKWTLPPEIYRGDSFQGVLETPDDIMKVAILSRTFMRSRKTIYLRPDNYLKNVFSDRSQPYAGKDIHAQETTIDSEKKELDIRIAIGIGSINRMTDRPGTSDGEAFRLSGKLADQIKEHKARIGIALPTPTDSLSAILDVFETLISTWSVPQCEVILGILTNESVSTLATRLNISRSAVSQRLKTSNWWAAERLIQTFPELINQYTQV